MTKRRWVRRSVRFLLSAWLLATTVSAFLFSGWMRTPHFGPSGRVFLITLAVIFLLLPHVVLALMHLWRRRALVGAIAWAVLVMVAVEGYAQAQEWQFKARTRDLPSSAEIVWEQRWWPFHWHQLIYLPETGEWQADC